MHAKKHAKSVLEYGESMAKRGNPNLDLHRNTDTTEATKGKVKGADEFARSMYERLINDPNLARKKRAKRSGLVSVKELTDFLDNPSNGYQTRTVIGSWHRSTVSNLLNRMDAVIGSGARDRVLG